MANVKLILFYVCKALEVILAACCIGLIFDPMRNIGVIDIVWATVWMMAFGSTVLICLVMIISGAAEGNMPILASLLFLFSLAVLNCAAGGTILKDYDDYTSATIIIWSKKYLRMILACGILAIINCLILLVDAALTLFLK